MKQKQRTVFTLLLILLLSCSHDSIELVFDKHDYSDFITERDIIRSYEEAEKLAEYSISLIESKETTRAISNRRIISAERVSAPATRSNDETPIFYIFNFDDNAGFSIISARKDMSPIIAVTEQGSYIYGESTGVEPFDEYMQMAINSIIEIDKPLRPQPIDSLFVNTETTDIERHCEPLVQTRWGQSQIFGMYCPNKVAGCGATAMAQIMSYHKFPETITTTYEDAPYAGQTINIPWDKVIPHVAYSSTCVNVLDCISNHYTVGALLREIGERIYMNYYNDNITPSSGCIPADIPDGFRSFGYTSNKLQPIDTTAIFRSLNLGRPLIAYGYPSSSNSPGHIWVIDGYRYSRHIVKGEKPHIVIKDGEIKTEYVWEIIIDDENILIHHNWGHNGRCNGFFDYDIYQLNNAVEYDNHDLDNNSTSIYCRSVGIIPDIKPASL